MCSLTNAEIHRAVDAIIAAGATVVQVRALYGKLLDANYKDAPQLVFHKILSDALNDALTEARQ